MPIIKSAKKRVRIAKKATQRNAKTKKALRMAVKAFNASLTTGKDVAGAFASAQSAIDTAVKKGILNKNKAARKKSQLNTAAKAAGKKVYAKSAKPAKKAAPTKKAPTTKKSPAKKPAKSKK